MATTMAGAHALELATPFADHMILQRGVKVPVWGWDQPGALIRVAFGGQEQTATADAKGEWRLHLPPLEASATGRMFQVANASGGVVEIQDVLVGEVWHASGEANMDWPAQKSLCANLAAAIEGAEVEVPIREFRVDAVSALYPQKRTTSKDGWKSSRKAGGFSALALSFAHTLHGELGVPIGILLTSHSNTRIEAFTARKANEEHPLLKADADLIRDGDVTTEQGREAFARYERDLATWRKESAKLAFPTDEPLPRPELPGIAGQWRGPSQFFNGRIAPLIPYAIRGSIWCQGSNNKEDGSMYAARMEALVKGWRTAWGMPDMPFYFTQGHCYGGGQDPDAVGFADLRQAQLKYFMEHRDNVGMVVQMDLNPVNPAEIHYPNKLHPGMRLARWALAKEYGKDIACTGPIFAGYEVKGSVVVVSFEKDSLAGGLMVGSKGQEKDFRNSGKYVEPAVETPGEALNHFRLLGKDRRWYAAEAKLAGDDRVVVTSKKVTEPLGVQYAYCAVPMNANLYNKAGLPATPFAAIEGRLIFEEDKGSRPTRPARREAPGRPFLSLASHFRPGVVLQRDQPIRVWGFANAGAQVSVTLNGNSQTAVAGKDEAWNVTLPPMKASNQPIGLTVKADQGEVLRLTHVRIGDVWFLTGAKQLSQEMAWDVRGKEAPAPMPWVHEFRRRTRLSTYPVPRKRWFEVGRDQRYRSTWLTADETAAKYGFTMFAYHFAKAVNRSGVPQGFITMSSGQEEGPDQMASPLSWTSYSGIKDLQNPSLRERVDALRLRDPSSDIAAQAMDKYLATVREMVDRIAGMGRSGADMSTAPLHFPEFPEPEKSVAVPPDAIPTISYNWCVSPFTPMTVAGVVWVPGKENIGHTPPDYAAELEAYAKSLPATYGLEHVPFYYAQPSASLVKGITEPKIPGAKSLTFDAWPESLKDLGSAMGALVE